MAKGKPYKRPTTGPIRKRLSREERFARGLKRKHRPAGKVAAVLNGAPQLYGVTLPI